ncbi:unnamed protein product [Cercopithifilaria johnstoni]|uniref:Uncharacterized protein n=1 Tax=Cercopithifilaria johnstoni TaxID=2874296 RepID=A0A8J2M3U5_9BILA|nr:unnamed protein product [Cercopithifilaria johnstoni]
MPRRAPSESESTSIGTDENGENLITGVSASQEKVIDHSADMEKTSMRKSSSEDQLSQSFFFNDDIIGQRYVESAKLSGMQHIHGTKIIWKRTQNVLELPILGHFRTYEKHVERSRPNPWRRHGALLKIYEIGGWISKMEKQQTSRRNRKYFYVKSGTKPCHPPTRPPISIRDSKFLPPSSINISSVTGRSIDELAFLAAIQIQEAMQNAIMVFLESRKIGTAKRDRTDSRNGNNSNEKMKSEEGSSSEQQLSLQPIISSDKTSRSRSSSLLGNKSR